MGKASQLPCCYVCYLMKVGCPNTIAVFSESVWSLFGVGGFFFLTLSLYFSPTCVWKAWRDFWKVFHLHFIQNITEWHYWRVSRYSAFIAVVLLSHVGWISFAGVSCFLSSPLHGVGTPLSYSDVSATPCVVLVHCFLFWSAGQIAGLSSANDLWGIWTRQKF